MNCGQTGPRAPPAKQCSGRIRTRDIRIIRATQRLNGPPRIRQTHRRCAKSMAATREHRRILDHRNRHRDLSRSPRPRRAMQLCQRPFPPLAAFPIHARVAAPLPGGLKEAAPSKAAKIASEGHGRRPGRQNSRASIFAWNCSCRRLVVPCAGDIFRHSGEPGSCRQRSRRRSDLLYPQRICPDLVLEGAVILSERIKILSQAPFQNISRDPGRQPHGIGLCGFCRSSYSGRIGILFIELWERRSEYITCSCIISNAFRLPHSTNMVHIRGITGVDHDAIYRTLRTV